MWDLPRPGLKPVSPSLAGRFLTTVPPGKPYVFIFSNIFFIFLILSYFLFFVIVLLFFFFFAMLWGLQNLDSQARGWAWAPVVGVPSPNCWTNREPQSLGNINQCEVSWRSSSWPQDPALSNCLQTPVCRTSQAKQQVRQKHSPTNQKKNDTTICYKGAR